MGSYLLHMPVSEAMHQNHLLLPASNRFDDVVNLFLQIAVAFAAAALSFHLFESRFLELKRYFGPKIKRRQPQAPLAAERTLAAQGVALEAQGL